MKMYKLEFMKVEPAKIGEGVRYRVFHNQFDGETNRKVIFMDSYSLITKESDLETLKEYGGGFRNLKYIGELFENHI